MSTIALAVAVALAVLIVLAVVSARAIGAWVRHLWPH
jgi:hypothetical protein